MTQTGGEMQGPRLLVRRIFSMMAKLQGASVTILRCGLVLVLVWIGGLKFAKYEADSVVPLADPAKSYLKRHGWAA